MLRINLNYRLWALVTIGLFLCFSAYGRTVIIKAGIPLEKQLTRSNTTYIIDSYFNCKGASVVIPTNSSLIIKSGKIVNGFIRGNNTKLAVELKKCIGVVFSGTWKSPVIDDSFFDTTCLSDDQIMHNINVLQSDSIKNTIVIGAKDYLCNIKGVNGCVLALKSNAICFLESTISLSSCDIPNYQIIQIHDVHDVSFSGGHIIGDMLEHKYSNGSTHEWGHGISIKNSRSIYISSVCVKFCTGDGVNVSGWMEPNLNMFQTAAKNVVLNNLLSDNNRRQALTIGHVDGLVVRGCTFINTGKIKYTAPAAGIDIEPNAEMPWNQGVRDVLIEDCIVCGNKNRDFLSHGYINNSIGCNFNNIVIRRCYFKGNCDIHTGAISFVDTKLESATLRGGRDPIDSVSFKGCHFYGSSSLIIQQSMFKDNLGNYSGGEFGLISLSNCDMTIPSGSKFPLFKSLSSDVCYIKQVILDNCTIMALDPVSFPVSLSSGKFNGHIQMRNTNISVNGIVVVADICHFKVKFRCDFIKIDSGTGDSTAFDRCTFDTYSKEKVLDITNCKGKLFITESKSLNKTAKAFHNSHWGKKLCGVFYKNVFTNDNSSSYFQ